MTHPSWEKEFESYTEQLMERHQIPGAAVALSQNGELSYERGFGYRDVERGLPATPNTVFGVGSITKSFTALSVMQLAERGRLSIEDPVVKYLPEFKVPNEQYNAQITLHHLLTHTSGLPPLPSRFYAQYRDIMADPNRDRIPLPYDVSQFHPIDTFEDLMELMAGLDFELLGKPGEFYSYSNESYALLGAIVQRVSGEPYAEYVREHILEPVGMEHTAFSPTTVAGFPEVTQLYSSRMEEGQKQVFATPGWWEKRAMYSCGHLKSTVRDLLRYVNLYGQDGRVNGHQVASPETVKRMTQPHASVLAAPGVYYGHGFAIEPDFHGTKRIKHGGGDKGVSAHLTLLPEKGVAVAVLTNLSGVPADKIALGALHAALGLAVDTPEMEYVQRNLPEDRLQAFSGSYRSGEGARIRFWVEDGHLWVLLGDRKLAATPVAHDAVLVQPNPDTENVFRFLFNGREQAWAVAYGLRILQRVEEDTPTVGR